MEEKNVARVVPVPAQSHMPAQHHFKSSQTSKVEKWKKWSVALSSYIDEHKVETQNNTNKQHVNSTGLVRKTLNLSADNLN